MLTVLANIILWDEHASPAATRVRESPRPARNPAPWQPPARRRCAPERPW